MTTLATLLTSVRYDLRDSDSNVFSDAELVDFFNRMLFQLDTILDSMDSDWVRGSTTLSLSKDASSVSLPSDFLSDNSLWYGTAQLDKEDLAYIEEFRQLQSVSGRPTKYAIGGSSVEFNYTADAAYDFTFYYNKKNGTLTPASTVPYNDVFNEVLIKTTVLCAKNRNEYDIMGDSLIYDTIRDLALTNTRRRKLIRRLKRPYT